MTTQLATIVKQARMKKKLSQTQVAKELGTTIGFIGKVERGDTGIKPTKLKKLSKVLRIPVKTLVAAKVADYEKSVWKTVRSK